VFSFRHRVGDAYALRTRSVRRCQPPVL